MRATTFSTYEVEVSVKGEPFEYYAKFGKRISHEVIKMFHFDRRKPEQARAEGEKYGRVISVRKVDIEKIMRHSENMELNQTTLYDLPNPYKSALHMESMIWKKRNVRRANLDKDKESY